MVQTLLIIVRKVLNLEDYITIYHIDMMKPQSYFLAQMFEMQDKDVILFANSRANLAQKMAALLGNLFSPATALVYATK